MHRLKGALSATLLVGLGLATVFGGLLVRPDALIVDGERASLDHAMPRIDRVVGNDLTRLFLPLHLRVGAEWRRTGRVPTWDPAGFGGRPLVGNPQAGLWYPPIRPVWWSGAPAALGWLTIAHLAWGAFGTYSLARRSGAGSTAASASAAVAVLSPYMLAQVAEGHLPHVWAAGWYPWAILGFVIGRSGEDRGWIVAAVSLAMCFLTGHPQEAFYLSAALGAWAICVAIAEVRGGRAARAGRIVVAWGATAVFGIGMTAVEWLPDAMAGRFAASAGRASVADAGRYHVGLLNVLQVVNPFALGEASDYIGPENFWESVLGIGLVPLMLGVVAVVRRGDRRIARPWLIVAALATVFAAGRGLGLFSVLYASLPGMGRFRVPARSLFLANTAVAILVGLGVDALGRIDTERLAVAWRKAATGLCAGVIGLAALAGILGADPEPARNGARLLNACVRLFSEPTLWGAVLGATVLTLLLRTPVGRRNAAILATVAVTVELATYGARLVPVSPRERFLGDDPIVADLRRIAPGGPFRVRARDAAFPDLPATLAGVEKTNINDAFQLGRPALSYRTLYDLAEPAKPRDTLLSPAEVKRRDAVRQSVLQRMNVAFVLAEGPLEALSDWRVAAEGSREGRHYAWLANPDPLPRAYVVPFAERIAPLRATPQRLVEVDPRRVVVLEGDEPEPATGARTVFREADYRAEAGDRLTVTFETTGAGYLVVADAWMPGWSATLDGRPAPIRRADGWGRAVAVSAAGHHVVRMRYEPPGLATGFAISVWSWRVVPLLWLGLAWRARRLRFVRSAVGPAVRPSRFACGATTRR